MDRGSFIRRTAAVVMGVRTLDGTAIEEAFVELAPFDDPATHVALHRSLLSEMDGILRDLYLDTVRTHLNEHSILLEAR